jgi:hypothetical protein
MHESVVSQSSAYDRCATHCERIRARLMYLLTLYALPQAQARGAAAAG